jgi:pimeloyl-ACP methyl ester carboxylesterase
MIAGLQHRRFTSFDGTEIAYQARGEGPCVVLANGLGGTFEAFRHIYADLADTHRVLCWDYRGMYRSGRPRDRQTLTVPHHARDLACLLDAEGIDRAVVLGWSMGVQVALEFFRSARARVAGLVAINGTYGSPFETVMGTRLSGKIIPLGLRLMKGQASLVSRVSGLAAAWSGLVPLLARLGFVSMRVDQHAMAAVARDWVTMDFALYADILHRLGEHDARDILPAIDVPTLIITGSKDVFTPMETARTMNREIVGSRLIVIPGATHYAPLEYPQRIGSELVRFLQGIRGFGGASLPPP